MKIKARLKTLAALVLGASLLAGCTNTGDSSGDSGSSVNSGNGNGGVTGGDGATYTYNLGQIDTPTTFNVQDNDTVDYIVPYTEIGMWELILNDTLDGYV
ncbi:MAG: hypothetical protein NC299_01670 [Lachnospiraceae bacterium]|nr:hypothetical protein [Ruminococcus sp.]MCM1274057.1 hypothetical protein [Lachnospiraceae bacterium]